MMTVEGVMDMVVTEAITMDMMVTEAEAITMDIEDKN